MFEILKVVVPLVAALILLGGTFSKLPNSMQRPYDSVFVFPKKVIMVFAGILIVNSVLMIINMWLCYL